MARDAQWQTVTLLKQSTLMSEDILETCIPRILECLDRNVSACDFHLPTSCDITMSVKLHF